MKRKRSPELGVVQTRKKKPHQSPDELSTPCPLLLILQQYGLLVSISSGLSPEDLLALALSTKAIYHAISPRPCSLENLLGKLSCPGKGVQIRQKIHKKSSASNAFDCKEYVQCGSTSESVESRPCIHCKVSTCNECRIHCVYQSNYLEASDPDELPYFSGYTLLSPLEVPIISPHHMRLELQFPGPLWQDPSAGKVGPYHDQGFIDVPFDDDQFAPPEFVDEILDLDLGQQSLAVSVSSDVPDPSPVLQVFHKVSQQRMRRFCDMCLPSSPLNWPDGIHASLCQCTLRGRFLDRWLCLRCYEMEELALAKSYPKHVDHCGCGQESGQELTHVVCLWCKGLVLPGADSVDGDLPSDFIEGLLP